MVAMATGKVVNIGKEKEGISSFFTSDVCKDRKKREISTGAKESLPDKNMNKALNTGQH